MPDPDEPPTAAPRCVLAVYAHPDDPEVVRPVAVDAALIGKLRVLASGIDDLLAGLAGGGR